mmetsp:Transcript_5923/g.7585  ORF Transcript_5923/g.7585 Transcript_5923/m.7585 type:complete len:276 (+) Transcript_5923:2369-3196(+)
MSKLVDDTNKYYEEYKFGEMIQILFDFWKKELADVYLEAIKPVMKGNNEEAKKAALNTLYICIDHGMKLLHPAMPYLSEELYQRLPHHPANAFESITIAAFPKELKSYEDEKVEQKLDTLMATIKAIRSQMVALNVPPKSSPVVYIRAGNDDHKNMFESESIIVTTLAKLGEVHVIDTAAADPADCLKGFVNDEISFYVKVVGLIDPKLEINRLEKRVKQLSQLADKLIAKTKAPGYEQKVPEKIRNDNADKIATYQSELQEIEKSKATLAQFAK